MTTTELREKLTAELAEVKPRAEALWADIQHAKAEHNRIVDEWMPFYQRVGKLERQIATLDALDAQLAETKSPTSESGANENTTVRTQS